MGHCDPPSAVPFPHVYPQPVGSHLACLCVTMWSLPDALGLLLQAPLNADLIWSFSCFLPQFPRRILYMQGVGSRICWKSLSGAFIWHLLFVFIIPCDPVWPQERSISLEICNCKSQARGQDLTEQWLYFHIPPSLGALDLYSITWMPRDWRVTPCCWCTPFCWQSCLSYAFPLLLAGARHGHLINFIRRYLIIVCWVNEWPPDY